MLKTSYFVKICTYLKTILHLKTRNESKVTFTVQKFTTFITHHSDSPVSQMFRRALLVFKWNKTGRKLKSKISSSYYWHNLGKKLNRRFISDNLKDTVEVLFYK